MYYQDEFFTLSVLPLFVFVVFVKMFDFLKCIICISINTDDEKKIERCLFMYILDKYCLLLLISISTSRIVFRSRWNLFTHSRV